MNLWGSHSTQEGPSPDPGDPVDPSGPVSEEERCLRLAREVLQFWQHLEARGLGLLREEELCRTLLPSFSEHLGPIRETVKAVTDGRHLPLSFVELACLVLQLQGLSWTTDP
mmetsp:Transcript_20055/g.28717  ORF Transcript_20055/g.28717 Transcript_20055/m.28717 type:complete len:112 (+) Transcript_20055:436-771(+)